MLRKLHTIRTGGGGGGGGSVVSINLSHDASTIFAPKFHTALITAGPCKPRGVTRVSDLLPFSKHNKNAHKKKNVSLLEDFDAKHTILGAVVCGKKNLQYSDNDEQQQRTHDIGVAVGDDDDLSSSSLRALASKVPNLIFLDFDSRHQISALATPERNTIFGTETFSSGEETIKIASASYETGFDVGVFKSNREQQSNDVAEFVALGFPQPWVLREQSSGAIFAGRASGTLVSLPRLGLGAGVMLPPPPFRSKRARAAAMAPIGGCYEDGDGGEAGGGGAGAGGGGGGDSERMTYLSRHIRASQRAANFTRWFMSRHRPCKSSPGPLQQQQRQQFVAPALATPRNKLVCVHEGLIVDDAAEAMRQVAMVCDALLFGVRFVRGQRGVDPDSIEELALWQDCVCKVFDMFIRERGCVVPLVRVLQQESPEATFFHDLVMQWCDV